MDPDPLDITHRWLQVLADADYDAWPDVAAEGLVIHTPFAPPGMNRISVGRDVCLAMARGYGELIKKFRYLDIDLHRTDDPERVFGTARSEALTQGGTMYRNQYCVIARVRGHRIVEYTEYFDPLQVMAAASAIT